MTRLSDTPPPYGTPSKPGISLDFVSNINSVTGLSDEDNAKAMRAVAGHATDAADARALLEQLGLIDPPTPSPAWRRAHKAKAAP